MAKIKLASRPLQISGGSRGLRPIQLSSRSAAGNIQSPYINPGIANIRYTPHQVPKIIVDNTLTEAGKLSKVWAESALKFQMRESQAHADQKLLELEGQLNKIYYGDDETVGYGLTENQNAVDGYRTFDASVKDTVASYIQDAEPNVRARMVEKAIAMQTKYLNSGATHKAKQFKSWQEQLSQAEYESVVREIIVSSEEDPMKFLETLTYRELELQEEFKGNDALIALKTQAFRDNIYDKTISYHLNKGNVEAAEFYLDRAYEAEVDPTVLGSTEAKLDQVLASKVQTELDILKAQNDLINEQQEAQEHAAVALFDKTKDPAVLESITDIRLRTALKDAYQKEREGYTDPQAAAQMRIQREALAKHPNLVFVSPEFNNVSYTDKIAYYNQLVADNKAGITELKNSAIDWAESLLPQKDPATGVWLQDEMAGMASRMIETLESAVDEARANNKSVHLALEDTKQQILEWPEFSNAEYATLNKARIPRLRDLPGGDLLNLMGSEAEYSSGILYENMGKAFTNLASKYGLTPGEQFMDISAQIKFIEDPHRRKQFMRDLTVMQMQVAYARRQATLGNSPASTADGASNTSEIIAPSSQNNDL